MQEDLLSLASSHLLFLNEMSSFFFAFDQLRGYIF